MIQNWPVVLTAMAILMSLIAAGMIRRSVPAPYLKRESLVTRNELLFFRELRVAIDDRWSIFSMVRMADLIKVRPGTKKRQSWQSRINCKHIDFVICDDHSLEALLAIELDDRSHQRADRIRRDEFVNEALAAAGLPLLRIKAARDYSAREIREQIEPYLKDFKPSQSRRSKDSRRRKRATRMK